MNKLITFLFSIAVCATSVLAEQPASSHQKYTCVMHPEVVQDKPGACPKCGMTLVPKKTEGTTPPAVREDKQNNGHDHDIITHEAQRLGAHQRHEMSNMPMEHMPMHSSTNIADPMNRESSGTALPVFLFAKSSAKI